MTRVPGSLAAVLAGLLFGLGLAISGMMDPARVIGFLDVAGRWNPSLAFVLAGAVLVSAFGYAVVRRLSYPLFAPKFEIPRRKDIDLKLVGGAALFGIGWGLSGFCPGPALASLTLGLPASLAFVAAMLLGMALTRLLPRSSRSEA